MLLKISYKEETHLTKLKQNDCFKDIQTYIMKIFKKLPINYTLVYLDEDADEISLDNQNDLKNLLESEMPKVLIKILQGDSRKKDEGTSEMFIKEYQSLSPRIQNFKDVQQNLNNSIKSQKKSKVEELNLQKEEQSVLKVQQKQRLIEKEKEDNKVQPQNGKEEEEIAHIIHENVRCDLCGACPIIGIRYKCSLCPDYDLCANCQEIYDHEEHAMLKIKDNRQQYQRKESNMVELLGSAVICGRQKIKKAFTVTVAAVKKIATKQEKKVSEEVKIDQQLENNIIAALDKLKPKAEQKLIKEQSKLEKKEWTEEDKIFQRANYLNSLLGIDFSRCYNFVKKYPKYEKEELIVKYFENQKAI